MDTRQILTQLKAERSRLDAAISALEGLDGIPARKPAGNTGKVGAKGQAKHKRKISAAARKKMSEAARARWAVRKKAKN
jgi:hypothetical protein